jgi:cation diffusion facilitator CzcD-associated flavoprotein CzcO
MDHVDLIDVNADPIIEVTEKGIKTQDGGVVEVDTIILATGFDSVTGSLAQLNIQGINGGTIADHWKNGTTTAMGIALNEFPNRYVCGSEVFIRVSHANLFAVRTILLISD